MADYAITPIPPPPPAPPPPAPAAAAEDEAAPRVTEVSVSARRVVFVDAPARKGTVEWQVTLTAVPDQEQPASASLDRLAQAARLKLHQYLAEAE